MSYPFHRPISSAAVLLCVGLVPGLAVAQSANAPAVSPVAPPTLKAPVFDTTTPAYNIPDVKKAGSTLVAEVDGVPITLAQLADAIKELPPALQGQPYQDLYGLTQNRLIVKQSLLIEAHQKGIDSDPDVQRHMREAADQVLMDEYVRREAANQIAEKDLLDRYARTVAGKPGPDEVHLRVMVLPTQAQAADVIKQLQGGADFAALAQKFSTDLSASRGGDLGFATRDKLVPEIAAAAFATAPGQILPFPVQSSGAWFVIKVDERRQLPPPAFAAVRAELLEDMIREKLAEIGARAVSGRTVRKFTIAGKEVEALPPATPQ